MQGGEVLFPEFEVAVLRSEPNQLIMRRAEEGGERLPSRRVPSSRIAPGADLGPRGAEPSLPTHCGRTVR